MIPLWVTIQTHTYEFHASAKRHYILVSQHTTIHQFKCKALVELGIAERYLSHTQSLIVEALDSVASQFEVMIKGTSEIEKVISTDLDLAYVLENEWWGQQLQLRERSQSKLAELFKIHQQPSYVSDSTGDTQMSSHLKLEGETFPLKSDFNQSVCCAAPLSQNSQLVVDWQRLSLDTAYQISEINAIEKQEQRLLEICEAMDSLNLQSNSQQVVHFLNQELKARQFNVLQDLSNLVQQMNRLQTESRKTMPMFQLSVVGSFAFIKCSKCRLKLFFSKQKGQFICQRSIGVNRHLSH